MTGDDVRAFTQGFFEDFSRGDVIACAARLDEDIDWFLHAPVTVFPFAGPRHGRSAVLAAVASLFMDYQFERHEVEFAVTADDRSAVMMAVALTQRTTGRLLRLRAVSLNRYRNGRLAEYHGFLDSFDAVEQALGGWLDLTRTMARGPDERA